MNKRIQIALSITALVAWPAMQAGLSPAQEPVTASAPGVADQTPLTAEEVHQLILRTIENQHRDDAALDSFEHIEHHTSRAGSADNLVRDERTYRVVPTGSGTLKLLLSENGTAVAPAVYERQLRDWEGVLEVAVHSDDPREIAVVAKQQKRRKENARLIDAVPSAYQISWVGREVRDGRAVEKLRLVPNPNYLPQGDRTDWLTHASAIAWIDPQAAQVVAVDATIIRDISVGGGVLGKIYRGGHFVMEQAPATADIWEPTLYQYDISGRKFLFSFAMHDSTTSTHYVFIGTPEEALEEARNNLAHCQQSVKGR
jgi:hypothetical protein